MDDIEAVRMARRALGNARNGIEAHEASLDLVAAERVRHRERLGIALRLMAAEVGTSRQGKKVAHALDRAGFPGPLAAWRPIQREAETRTAAEDAVRDAERAILQIDIDLKTVGGWVDADEASLRRLRESGIPALTPENAEAAAAAARAAADRSIRGMLRALLSEVGRQAMRYVAANGGGPAVLRPLHEVSVLPRKQGVLRLKEKDREAAAAALADARARVSSTPEPDAREFQAALARAAGESPEAVTVIGMVADFDRHIEASLEHPGQMDRLEKALKLRVEALRGLEAWLVSALAAPTVPPAVVELLPQAAAALAIHGAREPLRQDDLAPGQRIDASIRSMEKADPPPTARHEVAAPALSPR